MNLNRLVLILSCAILTFGLRAFPFLILGRKELPKRVAYVGKVLPMAIMATLVVYCMKAIPSGTLLEALPMLMAITLTAVIHIWKKNTVLSILIGTAGYMILIRLI